MGLGARRAASTCSSIGAPSVGSGNLSLSFLASYLDSFKTQASPTAPWVEYKGTFGPTLPGLNGGAFDYRTFTTVSYFKSKWNLGLRWRHLPSIKAAAAATATTTTLPTNAYDVFDLTGGIAFSERWSFRYGIDNLLDTRARGHRRDAVVRRQRDERQLLRRARPRGLRRNVDEVLILQG